MSRIGSTIQRAVAKLEAQLGTPIFIWHGQQFPCVTTVIRRGTEISIGGHELTVDLTVLVRKNATRIPITADNTIVTVDSTFITVDQDAEEVGLSDNPNVNTTILKPAPTAGKKLAHGRKQYRIINVGDAPGGSHWEIDLADVSR